MHIKKLLYFFCFIIPFNAAAADNKQIEKQSYKFKTNNVGLLEKKISIVIDGKKVGSVCYKKMLNNAVIYDLYIFPDHRKKGFGTALLKYACETLCKKNVTKIFIQPAPFEFVRGKKVRDASDEKLQSLVELCAQSGFIKADKSVQVAASFFYFFASIDGHADCLMMYQKDAAQ